MKKEILEKLKMNVDNDLYVSELNFTDDIKIARLFLRRKMLELYKTEKIPTSLFSAAFWRIRGYSEEETTNKIRELQGKNNSIEHKIDKLVRSGKSILEAKAIVNIGQKKLGKRISETHAKFLKNNPDHFHKMSHHFKEFWMNKGFSEIESLQKVMELSAKNRKRFREKLDKVEIEKGWNNTTLEYYLKKGLSLKNAKIALKERQSTFTLKKCIAKLGQEEGTLRFVNRQIEWIKKWKDLYYAGAFSTAPLTLNNNRYSKPSIELFTVLSNFYIDACWGINEYFISGIPNYFYDFTLINSRKIIEFNGSYWHCDPEKYDADYFHFVRKMYAKDIWAFDDLKKQRAINNGFVLLTIWENEFKLFPEETIHKCKIFLDEN